MLVVPPPPQSIISRATGVEVADAFSTDLYTGTGASQSITNGIDLSTEGGMVWIKSRDVSRGNIIWDTERGATKWILTNGTNSEATDANGLTSFNSNGYTIGSMVDINTNTENFVGWTFRKAAGFFDVVEYTGNATAGRTLSHNLGVAPGAIFVKRTDSTDNWVCYHRSSQSPANEGHMRLNATNAVSDFDAAYWNSTDPTSTDFTLGSDGSVNGSGLSYVAYVFAHDPTGIIQCGSYTGNGSATGPTISLGWEPQFVLLKNASSAYDWYMFDNQRGMTTGNDPYVTANTSNAETTGLEVLESSGTGFQIKSSVANFNENTSNIIYMAIKAE